MIAVDLWFVGMSGEAAEVVECLGCVVLLLIEGDAEAFFKGFE